MKKAFFLLFAAFLFSYISLSAQFISKGTYTVGSSLSFPGFSQPGFYMSNQGGFTTTKIENEVLMVGNYNDFFDRHFINSGYSYFLANDFSVGADLMFGYSKTLGGDETLVFLSIEFRRYLRSPFFLSIASNLSYVDTQFNFKSASFGAGYNFFVSSDWAIEAHLLNTHPFDGQIRTLRGDGFIGELSFRYFPGRKAGDSTAVESALKQGNFLFGGSGTFSSAQKDVTYIYFSPRAGYFVTDNLVLGAGLNYVYQKLDNSSSVFGPSSETNQVLLGNVFARYYLYNGLFAELEGGLMLFNSLKIDGETPEIWNPSASFYNVILGYSWFISPSIALEPSLRFGRVMSSDDAIVLDEESNRTIETLESVQQSFGLEFSIHVFLNR